MTQVDGTGTVIRDGMTIIEPPTIHESLAAVMRDVGPIAKGDHNPAQNFSFRGIDSVVNVVGPVLRDHGVIMMPTAGEPTVDHYTTRNGANMTHVLLPVTFTFYGPAGDSLECRVIGEAADAGDKVMSKAHSVAWRVAMLEVFAIPTDEPDPDAATHERAPDADPEEWFKANGWESKQHHDEEYESTKADAAKLSADSKDHLKAWWKEHGGFKLPLPADRMVDYGNKVDELAELEKVAE